MIPVCFPRHSSQGRNETWIATTQFLHCAWPRNIHVCEPDHCNLLVIVLIIIVTNSEQACDGEKACVEMVFSWVSKNIGLLTYCYTMAHESLHDSAMSLFHRVACIHTHNSGTTNSKSKNTNLGYRNILYIGISTLVASHFCLLAVTEMPAVS